MAPESEEIALLTVPVVRAVSKLSFSEPVAPRTASSDMGNGFARLRSKKPFVFDF